MYFHENLCPIPKRWESFGIAWWNSEIVAVGFLAAWEKAESAQQRHGALDRWAVNSYKNVNYSAKGSLVGSIFVIKNILMAVVVGTKNPVWFSFSGMATQSCSIVKPFISTIWLEFENSWIEQASSLNSPHPEVNTFKVCAFRTVAEIKIWML